VVSPLGETVSLTNQSVPSGGTYNADSVNVATTPGQEAQQEIDWGFSGTTIPSGTYTLVTKLVGTTNGQGVVTPLTPTSTVSVSEQVSANLTATGGVGAGNSPYTFTPFVTLNAKNPTESFQINVPFANNAPITAINSAGKQSTLIP